MTEAAPETITLISKGYQQYESEDGRVDVHVQDDFETWCDNEPHPMKERVDSIRARFTDPDAADRYIAGLHGKTIHRRTKDGYVAYLTYQCPGDQIHYYSQWVVNIDGDWTDDVYERFEHALSAVEEATGAKVKVSRRRKPKPEPKHEPETTVDEHTGRAYWAACGHPAEYDINMDCYVCHQDPAKAAA